MVLAKVMYLYEPGRINHVSSSDIDTETDFRVVHHSNGVQVYTVLYVVKATTKISNICCLSAHTFCMCTLAYV